MLNSDEIFAVIQNISSHPGKLDKQTLVNDAMKDEVFKRVCEYAYNPFKTFGIAKRPLPGGSVHGDAVFSYKTWALLSHLTCRRVTGNAAIECVRDEMSALSVESAELFWRIIKKDLRADFSESTINKACKGLIPTFPYMRCSLPKDAKLTEFDWGLGVLSQEKADGMFANIDHEPCGDVKITSRQGSEFPIGQFRSLAFEVRDRLLTGTQSHGEILIRKAGVICAREIGNGILNSVLKGGEFEEDEVPFFLIWDQIPTESVVPKGKYVAPYVRRLSGIQGQLACHSGGTIRLINTRVCHSLAEAYAHAGELMKAGKEGSVIKDPHAPWADGTSKFQVKLKLEFKIDLKVTAIMPGKEGGKTEGRAGSLACTSSCGELRVDVTVKNEAMRASVDAHPDDWIGRIIEVVANDVMKPGGNSEVHSLFLPRMADASYRTDKTEADDLKSIFAQKETAILGASLMEVA